MSQSPLAGTSSQAAAETTPTSASSGMRRRPSASRVVGSWSSTITIVLMKKSQPIPRSRDAGLVLGERGQDLELRDPGPDVERVGGHQRHEDLVPEDRPVAAGALGARSSLARGVGDEDGQDGGVGDERERVEHEERPEALRRDEAAGDAAEADAEVHHHALHRERRRALRARRQPGEQRRLRRPEERRCRCR